MSARSLGQRGDGARLDPAFGNFPQAASSPLAGSASPARGSSTWRAGANPDVRTRLTFQRFVALNHVLVSPRGEQSSVLDRLLGARGLRRRVAFTTSASTLRDLDG